MTEELETSRVTEDTALTRATPAQIAPHLQLEPPDIDLTTVDCDAGDRRSFLLREGYRSRAAAALRALAVRVAELRLPRVIVVTSPGAGGGKTTVATNLALGLSELFPSRVLLLEACAESPQIAEMFGFLPPRCFAEQLEEHSQIPYAPWHIAELASTGLHVLAVDPAGRPEQPVLAGPTFAFAIHRLRDAGYTYIIVDASSVLDAAQAIVMSATADSVILAVRARHTSLREIRAACHQLGEHKLLGTVLIGA